MAKRQSKTAVSAAVSATLSDAEMAIALEEQAQGERDSISLLSSTMQQVQPSGSMLDGNAPKTPKDKASEAQIAEQEMEAICDDAQQVAVRTFWEAAKQLHAELRSRQALFDEMVHAIHPTGVAAHGVYKVVLTFLKTRGGEIKIDISKALVSAGDYAERCYRTAVRRMPGMGCKRDESGAISVLGRLPSAGDSRSTGAAKGTNAKKWFQGVHRGLKTMMDRAGKVPKDLIDAPALAAWREAYKAMVAADKALAKAIAQDTEAGKPKKKKTRKA